MFTGCSIARHENTLSPFSFPSPPPQPSSQNFPLPLPSPLPIRSLAELNQTDEGPSAFHALNIRLITFSYVLLDEQPTLRSINTRVPRTPCRYLTSGKKISGWMDERMDGRMVFRIDRGQKLETRGGSSLPPPPSLLFRLRSSSRLPYVYPRLPYASFSPSFDSRSVKRVKKREENEKSRELFEGITAGGLKGGGSVIGNCDRHLDRRQETFPLLFSATPISSLAGFLVEPVPRSDVTRSSSWISTLPLGYRREYPAPRPPPLTISTISRNLSLPSRDIDEIMKRLPVPLLLRRGVFLFEFNLREKERERVVGSYK